MSRRTTKLNRVAQLQKNGVAPSRAKQIARAETIARAAGWKKTSFSREMLASIEAIIQAATRGDVGQIEIGIGDKRVRLVAVDMDFGEVNKKKLFKKDSVETRTLIVPNDLGVLMKPNDELKGAKLKEVKVCPGK